MATYNRNSGYGRAFFDAIHSLVPTFGRIFVVVDTSDAGGDDYDRALRVFGSDPHGLVRFYSSVSDAYDACTSSNNDVIVLSTASTHNLTTMLDWTKSRTHMVGLDPSIMFGGGRRYGARAKVSLANSTTAADIATLKVTGVGCVFKNIKFLNSSTVDANVYCVADGGEFTYMENCEIYKSSDLDQDAAAELLMNGDSCHYRRCTIGSNANAVTATGQRPNVLLNRQTITGKVCRDTTFEDCLFWYKANGATSNVFVYGSGATDVERMLLFKDCIFHNTKLASQTMANAIHCASAQTEGYVILKDCTAVGITDFSNTTGVMNASGAANADNGGEVIQTT